MGELYTYHYGEPPKGVNPVTLREHFAPLGQGSEFVCDHCVRWCFVGGLLRATRIVLFVAAAALISELYQRLSSGGLAGDPSHALYVFAVAAGSEIVLGALFRLRWKRSFQIESLLFERAHDRIAREQGAIAASRLSFYDSEFYARNISLDPRATNDTAPVAARSSQPLNPH